MKETIKRHMALALSAERHADYALGRAQQPLPGEDAEQHRAHVAQLEGAARGHLFRAAELAYDLAWCHARERAEKGRDR